jgi:hypothetical protein
MKGTMSKFITIDGLQSGLEITKTYIDDSIPTKVSELEGDELISNDKEFNIVDNNGCVAVSINKDGLHTAKLTVNGESLDTYIEGQISMISITYDELKTLRDSSSLIPGQHYRIVDYITTTTQTDTKSAGKPFDIIVIADSNNVLNEKARAIQRYGNTYFSNSNLAA